MNSNLILKTIFLYLLFVTSSQAVELKYTFGSIKTGYANWDMGAVDTDRGDLWKLVGDFGAVFDKGELYSFYEYNKFDHDVDNRNVSFMASGHYRLSDSDFTLFGKIYANLDNQWGDELNTMIGIGYLVCQNSNYFFKPFISIHELSSDYQSTVTGSSANGFNGYVLGWTSAFFFKVSEYNFTLSNWNEFEIGRNDTYSEQQYGSFGINGGLTLNWKMNKSMSLGVTYRYFQNKLSYEGYGDQMIFLFGYHF